MKILFYPYHLGHLSSRQSIRPITGLPMSVPYTMRDMNSDLYGATQNVGNIIHVEAPARLLEYNQLDSASTFLSEMASFHNDDPVETAREISKNFDYLIVSEANVFRLHGPNKEESEKETSRLRVNADILDNLTIPFAVIGAGIQSMPPDNLDDFDKNISYFTKVANKKATMLGVRGRATRDWLARAGIANNVKALGCPSLFLYPNNIRKIKYSPLHEDSSVLTAGYLNPHYINHARERVNITAHLASRHKTDFIMQDDFYQLLEGENLNHYDEATGLVDRDFVIKKLDALEFDASNVKNFYHFRNSYSWRTFSSRYDAYIGDRLHGGICAMQSGRPAVILHKDYRVEELADLFKFPSISVDAAIKDGIINAIDDSYTHKAITRFHEEYEYLYENFRKELINVGLKVRDPKN